MSLTDLVYRCKNNAASGDVASGVGIALPPREANQPYVLSHSDIIAGVQDVLLIPRRFPAVFREYLVAPPTGILLYGPSGTGMWVLYVT